MTFETALAHFQAQRHGSRWMAHCPAHDDGKASLSLTEGADGRVLLYCHARCPLDAILAAAGLATSDLFVEPKVENSRFIVAEYRYCDEHGQHLYDVVRFAPKEFRQRRADGVWSMTGVRRVLYRLPEIDGKDVVYIPEGEKDVDRLWKEGLTATTAVAGAGKWRAEYTEQLVRAKITTVLVLPDNDDPGRKHAEQIAHSCVTKGLMVKIVALPSLAQKGDISDWLDAGNSAQDLATLVEATPVYVPKPPSGAASGRVVQLTPASEIPIRPVRWLWHERIPLGALTLVGGREGIGKSLTVYSLGADITRGQLTGFYEGTPGAIVVVATEDSWTHTIVPRLMAAGADLKKVYRVDVKTAELIDTSLSLPRDLAGLEQTIRDAGAVLVVLDPLLSRLDTDLDSHKDADVRRALEPLVAVADRTGVALVGLIHVNKSSSDDPLTTLMASRAFAAVARSVLFVMADPDEEGVRLLGIVKNNLGRVDLPTLSFVVTSTMVAETDEGQVWTGKLEWTGDTDRSIRDALQATVDVAKCSTTAVGEATVWLEDFLKSEGGRAPSADVKKEARKLQLSETALQRARMKLGVVAISSGFPRTTSWMLPSADHPSRDGAGEAEPIETTDVTESTGSQSFQSSQSSQSREPLQPPAGEADANAGDDTDDGYY